MDRQQRIHRSEKLFSPDGTVHLKYIDYQLPENERALIYDINDKFLWQGNEDKIPDRYLKWSDTPRHYLNVYSLRRYRAIYPDTRRSIVVPVLDGRYIESLWRYEPSEKYFEGLDKDGNRIGYCGSSGFVQEKSQVKSLEQPVNFIAWTPVEGGGPIVLWQTDNSVYQINFRRQTVESLLQFTDKKINRIELNGWMKLAPGNELYVDNEKYRPLIVCITKDDCIFAILREPVETIQIKLPEEMKVRRSDITATKEKIYIRASYSDINPPEDIIRNSKAYIKWFQERIRKPIEHSEKLFEADSAGKLTLSNQFDWTNQARLSTSSENEPQEKFRKILSNTSAPFNDFFFRLFGRWLHNNLDRDTYEIFRVFIFYAPSYNPLSYILSLLMAGIVFIHALPRRKNTAGLIGWTVFAALFNVVGLFAYLALNYTPTVKCHNCNKRRGLNTPQCPHCGADLPVAVPDKLCIITGS